MRCWHFEPRFGKADQRPLPRDNAQSATAIQASHAYSSAPARQFADGRHNRSLRCVDAGLDRTAGGSGRGRARHWGRLFVRKRMPDKGWFVDSSRADTAAAVIGMMFAVTQSSVDTMGRDFAAARPSGPNRKSPTGRRSAAHAARKPPLQYQRPSGSHWASARRDPRLHVRPGRPPRAGAGSDDSHRIGRGARRVSS